MEPHPPEFRPRAFLLVTWAVNVSINAFYIAPAPVFPEMIRDLGISNAQAGALISAYLVSILLFQLPAGYVIDRRDPRTVIVGASLAFVALGVSMSLVPRYDALLALRILAGIPVAFIFVPSAFLVSRAFDRAPGKALGIFLSAPPSGVALGTLISPILGAAFGWPVVFAAFALPLLPLVPAFVRVSAGLPTRPRERFHRRDYFAAFRKREVWKVGMVFACSYAAYIFFASWTPTYLRATGVLNVAVIGVLSALIPAAGILSRPLGGHLAETTFARDKRWVPAIAFAGLFGVSLAVPFAAAGAVPLLIASGFLAQFPFSVYYLFSSQALPRRFGGTAYALMNTTSLVGGSISPALAGFLVDLTGGFTAAFAMIAATALLGLGLVAAVRER